MSDKPSVFYGYPGRPPDLGETIEAAIAEISQGGVVDISSWKKLRVGGKLIIDEILTAIQQASIFACDLTYINPNVLFELGYAIARQEGLDLSQYDHRADDGRLPALRRDPRSHRLRRVHK